MIVPNKTADGLCRHAEKALSEHWWYIWGTFGNKITYFLLKSKAKQYPKYCGGYMYDIHRRHMGETACDCVGLIKGYCMWDEKKDKPVYKPALDVNTGMMFNLARKRGAISTIPEQRGICVYKQGHVGVYVGNGEVIEMAGMKGAIKTPLKGGTPWTHWFECPYIDYSGGLKVGDKVMVKRGARTYTGGKLAYWVYRSEYIIGELKEDRAVIQKEVQSWDGSGSGMVTIAAVNIKDLMRA